MAVACVSAAAYLAVVWPTIVGLEIPNVAMRLSVLRGTAVSVGVLAELEQRERLRGATLSAEILDRERFIQSVVDNLSEGVFALDADGRIVAWNRAMETR
ncbi:MAG: PAS domain-containing protein, partial [Candidatus Rokubacteria bacterium]|nr:PAS domain-containing protein [Candidatus Rokubacteria bacterium]